MYNPNQPRDPKGRPTGGQFSRMSAVERARRKNAAPLPPEPGTMPIPEGHVRLYHQTGEDELKSIMKTGLGIKHARGIEGPRAVYAGETPFYGEVRYKNTFEFHVPKSQWDAPFVLRDVTPRAGVAHYPWQAQARYILTHPQTLKLAREGEFDYLIGSGGRPGKQGTGASDNEGRALLYIKRVDAFMKINPKFKPKK